MSAPRFLYVAVYDPLAVSSGIEELDELYRLVVISVSGEIDATMLIQHIGMLRGMTLFHEAYNGLKHNTDIEVILASTTITDIDAGKYHVITELTLTDSLAVQQATVLVKQSISNYTLLYGDGEDVMNRTIKNVNPDNTDNSESTENDLCIYWNSFLSLFNAGGITDIVPWSNKLNPCGALSMIPSQQLYRRSALGGIDFTVDCAAAVVFYTGKATVKNYGARYLKVFDNSIEKNGLISLYNLLEFLDYNGNIDALNEDLAVSSVYSIPVVLSNPVPPDSDDASNGNSLYGFFNPFNFDPREYYPQNLDPRALDPRQYGAQALNPLTITNKLVVLPLTNTVSTIGTWINGEHPTESSNNEDSTNDAGDNDEGDVESESSNGTYIIGLMGDESITKRIVNIPSNGNLKPFHLVLYTNEDHLFAVLIEYDNPGLNSPSFYEDLAFQFDSSLGMSRSVMTLNSLHELVADPNILYVICNNNEGSMRTSLPFLGPPAITYLHEQLIELGSESSPTDTEFLHKFRSNRSNDWTIYRIAYNDSIIFILRNHHRGNAVSTNRSRQAAATQVMAPAESIGIFEALGDDVKLWLSTLQDDV